MPTNEGGQYGGHTLLDDQCNTPKIRKNLKFLGKTLNVYNRHFWGTFNY